MGKEEGGIGGGWGIEEGEGYRCWEMGKEEGRDRGMGKEEGRDRGMGKEEGEG